MTRRRRGGFTAEELIVVLLLYSILVGLVYRVGQRVRDEAGTASCASNVRHVGIALRMYLSDFGQGPPTGARGFEPLFPHLRNTDVLFCPADRTPFMIPGEPAELEGAPPGPAPPGVPGPSPMEPPMHAISYILRPRVQPDDLPGLVVAGDDDPDRHRGKTWNGLRLDGAVVRWPADEWEHRLAGVIEDEQR